MGCHEGGSQREGDLNISSSVKKEKRGKANDYRNHPEIGTTPQKRRRTENI